jgi:hypothetical protein
MMKKIFTVLISAFFVWSTNATASTFSEFDKKLYYPQKKGLENYIVTLEVSGVTEKLKKSMLFGKVDKVFFKLYWLNDGRRGVEVYGLPAGFKEIKNKLRLSMVDKIEFISPTPLEIKSKGYQVKKRNDGYLLVDESGNKAVNSYLYYFNTNGVLSRTIHTTSMGTVENNYDYKKDEGELFILNRATTKITQGKALTKIVKDITYNKVKNFSLPSKVKISVFEKLPSEETGEFIQNKSESSIIFRDYQINSSDVVKWFLSQK